ncbi:MAG: SMC family ATPase [Pseudomonadales bacterium]|nr:SMC family ATPase [Pseudomonadales bacterium]
MRPEALELDGFTVFREPTRVDFADTDLFAFTGPTGAGKSSLIDAMIFALYGSVPRLDERSVAPVISQGRQDARVRLDFALGERRYTAVRIVRRGKGNNASTREARLECEDEVVAGNVRELDAEIRRLIGLDFQQFTTCAVLPQGEFARFLHARPAERQKLLTQLLGFGVYTAMRQQAGEKAVIGRDRMEVAEHRLDGLSGVNKKVEKGHATRLEALKQLQKEAADELSKIGELERDRAAIGPRRLELAAHLKALRAVRMPADVPKLASDLLAATQAVDAAEQALALAQAGLASAQANRADLGDKGELEEKHRLYRLRDGLERDLEEAKERTAQARERTDDHETAMDAAMDTATAARDALEAARRTHAAHELRGHLALGEACPVCGQSVVELPEGDKPVAVAELQQAEREANEVRETARRQHQDSAQQLAVAIAQESKVDADLGDVAKGLAGAPALQEIEDLLGRIATAEQEQQEAKDRLDGSRQDLIVAQRNRQTLATRESSAWTTYNEARDGLSGLAPPPAKSDDLPGSWLDLQNWATQAIPGITEEDGKLRANVEELGTELDSRRSGLAGRFEEHEVAFDDDPPGNLLRAVTQASIALADVQAKRREKKRLRAEIKSTKSEVDVAEALVRHLRADGFERWLLHEAFGRLAASASKLLMELSDRQYSFRHNEKLEFEVIDHWNAAEARTAKTLSGGETFLASLSLALALSDEVADFATQGAARLESIFLDEGFGTLDPDTLVKVDTAIDELRSRGRMVGIVTHVAALAESMPVQFKVSKASGSARVERVEI